MAAALATNEQMLGKSARDTAELLSKFDDIFDVMNSSRLTDAKYLHTAISDNNSHMDFIKDSIKWLSDIKKLSGKKDVSESVKCLKGWQLSLTAVKELWPILRDQYDFKFLFTRRLNQDPIENLFSIVRQRGGNCTNPTPYNFARILKQISCDKLLSPVKNGNCEIDLNQVLEVMCSANNPFCCKVRQVSQTRPNTLPIIVFRTNLLPYDEMNVMETNALHYVAGYLVRKLQHWHQCKSCNTILNGGSDFTESNTIFTNLTKIKDKYGLVNISQAFHFYIVRLEKALQSVIKDRIHEKNIAKIIYEELKQLHAPTQCIGFLKTKFIMFFIRLRLYYILKYENRMVVKSKTKVKIYKQFAHN